MLLYPFPLLFLFRWFYFLVDLVGDPRLLGGGDGDAYQSPMALVDHHLIILDSKARRGSSGASSSPSTVLPASMGRQEGRSNACLGHRFACFNNKEHGSSAPLLPPPSSYLHSRELDKVRVLQEMDLSCGAAATISEMGEHIASGLLSMLQVADVRLMRRPPRSISARIPLLMLLICNCGQLLQGTFVSDLNHFVADDAIHRGTMLHLLQYHWSTSKATEPFILFDKSK